MKILVGYKPTPEGIAALDMAKQIAGQRQAELVIFQHVPLLSGEGKGAETPAVRDALRSLEAGVRAEGVECRSSWSLGAGPGGRALLDSARDEEPDLLIIGIRRRSRVGKAILGSDAQSVLLGAEVPVLAVKSAEGMP